MKGKYAVLIADDASDGRFFLKMVIGKRAPDFKVVGEAPDGEFVMNYLNGAGEFADRDQHPFPDVLLLKFRLPTAGGTELLEWLQTQPVRPAKVVVFAEPEPVESESEALRLGADHVFSTSANLREMERIMSLLRDDLDGVDKLIPARKD